MTKKEVLSRLDSIARQPSPVAKAMETNKLLKDFVQWVAKGTDVHTNPSQVKNVAQAISGLYDEWQTSANNAL